MILWEYRRPESSGYGAGLSSPDPARASAGLHRGLQRKPAKLIWNKTPSGELYRVRALPSTMHDHELTKERREREKTEVLKRFRSFAKRSTWKKSRISRELGVSLSTVDRWLNGHDKIMLASMLEIRRFLAERERNSLLGQQYL